MAVVVTPGVVAVEEGQFQERFHRRDAHASLGCCQEFLARPPLEQPSDLQPEEIQAQVHGRSVSGYVAAGCWRCCEMASRPQLA